MIPHYSVFFLVSHWHLIEDYTYCADSVSPHVADQAEENDWLYTVAATIIAAHNAFIEGVYSPQVQEQSPSECFLPDKPAKVSPSEVNDSNCIVGKFERWAFSSHCT